MKAGFIKLFLKWITLRYGHCGQAALKPPLGWHPIYAWQPESYRPSWGCKYALWKMESWIFYKIKHPVALANESENAAVCLANDTEIDADGWGLIAPFGEWPKTRVYRENGQIKLQDWIQVLDNESAEAMTGRENSLFGRLKRALVGIPVYQGHGDLREIDPKVLDNGQTKIKLGVVDQVRKTERGIEAHFALDNDGAAAVAAGWKFPSALWWTLPVGKRGDAILGKPFKLISVALTKFPNISGVESLANAVTPKPAEQPDRNIMLIDRITGLLIGKGVELPKNAGENEIVAALANALDNDQADTLSARAHRKSASASDKASHNDAAMAHLRAADAQPGTPAADMHKTMATYHSQCAGNCDSTAK